MSSARAIKDLDWIGTLQGFNNTPRVTLMEPLPDVRFMSGVTGAKMVITDADGLLEEMTCLDLPPLMRPEKMERPMTIKQVTSGLVGAGNLAENIEAVGSRDWSAGQCPPPWDGRIALRAVKCLLARNRRCQ